MTEASFLRMVQTRTASVAIGASALRNQGAPNVVFNTREFLKRIDLRRFRAKTAKGFKNALDRETIKLQRALPLGARNWGAARKALNIFLRDVLYNHHLRKKYRFGRLERWLELPLDSYAARELCAESHGKQLQRWPGVKHVDSDLSKNYQDAAEHVAERLGVARVHLDLIYWRKS